MGEPVDFVFDVPIYPWWLACNKSVSEAIRPVKKLQFLYLQTVLINLIKQLGPVSYESRPSKQHVHQIFQTLSLQSQYFGYRAWNIFCNTEMSLKKS